MLRHFSQGAETTCLFHPLSSEKLYGLENAFIAYSRISLEALIAVMLTLPCVQITRSLLFCLKLLEADKLTESADDNLTTI